MKNDISNLNLVESVGNDPTCHALQACANPSQLTFLIIYFISKSDFTVANHDFSKRICSLAITLPRILQYITSLEKVLDYISTSRFVKQDRFTYKINWSTELDSNE